MCKSAQNAENSYWPSYKRANRSPWRFRMRWIIQSVFYLAFLFSTQVYAQKSEALTDSDPRKTYFSFKRSFDHIPSVYLDKSYGPLTFGSCISAGELFGIDSEKTKPFTKELAETAFSVLWVEGVLKKGKYPKDVWITELQNYEKQTLIEAISTRGHSQEENEAEDKVNEVSKKILVSLVQKLKVYRATHKFAHRVVLDVDGCGDMMGPVLKIEAIPEAKQIRYMTQHFALLCKEQGVDFKNERDCDYWLDYNPDLMVFGKYKFMIRWPSGEVVYRDYDIDRIKTAKDGARHVTVIK